MLYLIRYGEIALKSKPVRARMESALVRNISRALKSAGLKATIKRTFGRLFVEAPEAAEPLLGRVFGIVSFSPAQTCAATIPAITKTALVRLRHIPFKTFAVKTRRVGTHPFRSQDVNEQVGEAIRTELKKKVDLSKPDLTVWIEVRDKQAYLYLEKLPGQGGFPQGTQGPVACFLNTKNDLLAAWLFLKKGCHLILVDPKPEFAAVLESWAFRSLSQVSTLEDAVKKGALGIVTSRFVTHELPVYDPLLGLTSQQITKKLALVMSVT